MARRFGVSGDPTATVLAASGLNISSSLAGGLNNHAAYIGATADVSANIDTLVSIENVIGSDGTDYIVGSSGSNQIDANLGNDTVQATAGSDTLIGGGGVDTLLLVQSADGTLISAGASIDLSVTTAQTLSPGNTITMPNADFEILDASGITVGLVLTCNASANTLLGGSDNDTITGLGANAQLTGGLGIDIFNVDADTDTITDLGRGGADVLNVSDGASVSADVFTSWTATSGTKNGTGGNTYTDVVINTGFGGAGGDGGNVDLSSATATAGSGFGGFTVRNGGIARTRTGSAGAVTNVQKQRMRSDSTSVPTLHISRALLTSVKVDIWG